MLCKRHFGDGDHKFRFGVNGDFLRSSIYPRRRREKRNFPKHINETWPYVKAYFEMNSIIKEGEWLTQ